MMPELPKEFHRMHRLSPLLQMWTIILAFFVVMVANFFNEMVEVSMTIYEGKISLTPILWALGGFVLVCVFVWFTSGFWWRAKGYCLSEDSVILRQGVFSRQERFARYDRIEAVDVVRPVIARIFGVSAVRVETAGGTESNIALEFLSVEEAEQLRADLLSRVRGEVAEQEEATESTTVVDTIPIRRSLASVALSTGNWLGIFAVIALIIAPVTTVAVIPVVIGMVSGLWNFIDSSWKFTATVDERSSSLDVTFGLADLRRQSIPIDRIHAVSIRQPLLWRLTGWWAVEVSIAGYGLSVDKDSATTKLLPVGTWSQVQKLIEVIGPITPTALNTYAKPIRATNPSYTSPNKAKWISPIDWKNQAVTLVDDLAICHTGRLNKKMSVIHTSHIQELTLSVGPLQNLLGLCEVRFNLIMGPVDMKGEDLLLADGHALLNQLRQRDLPSMSESGAQEPPQ